MKEIERLHTLLALPVNNATADLTEENSIQTGMQSLFIISNVTRNVMFRYATINAAGNIKFHVMSPFKMVDQSQNNQNYQDKTVYVSVGLDTNENPNKPGEYGNNNLGAFATILTKSIQSSNSERPAGNLFNTIELFAPQLKFGYIPANLQVDLQKINTPFVNLFTKVEKLKEAKDEVSQKEFQKLMADAYQAYYDSIVELFSQGLLTFAHYFINPTPNSVSFATRLEKTMQSQSNPWFNINSVTSLPNIPLSTVPVPNSFQCVVNLLDNNTLGSLYSDNHAMLGERTIVEANDTRDAVKSLSVLATINDYNKDTNILLTINDTFNSKKGDRSRIEAFNALLNKGVSHLIVKGSLSPTVRLVGTDGARHGVIMMELRVDRYSTFNSSSTKQVMESDMFSNLDLGLDTEDGLSVGDVFNSVESLSISSDNDQDSSVSTYL